DRHADINETFVVEVRLNVVRIVKQHAAFFEKVDVVLIAVLIKRDQKIGFVTGREHFARAHADLKNGRSARDGGWNRHISHDVVVAASGQSREKRAGGLNSVLRISGKADDCVVDIFRTKIRAVRRRTTSGSGGWRCRFIRRGGLLDRGYVRINRIAHEKFYSRRMSGTFHVFSRAKSAVEVRSQRSAVRRQRSAATSSTTQPRPIRPETRRVPARKLEEARCCREKYCVRLFEDWRRRSETRSADANRICRHRCIAKSPSLSTARWPAARCDNWRSKASNWKGQPDARRSRRSRTT